MKSFYFTVIVFTCFICDHAFGQKSPDKISVPLGGNSWVTVKVKGENEKVTDNGWENWKNAAAVWSTYIYLQNTGKLKIKAVLPRSLQLKNRP